MDLELRLAAQTAAFSPLERLIEPWQTLALRVAQFADEHGSINLLTHLREALRGFRSSFQGGPMGRLRPTSRPG